MDKLEQLALEFSEAERLAGQQLFDSGAVGGIQSRQQQLFSQVNDGRLYNPIAEAADYQSGLLFQCECLVGRRAGACRHVWAMLLKADAEELLDVLPNDALPEEINDGELDDEASISDNQETTTESDELPDEAQTDDSENTVEPSDRTGQEDQGDDAEREEDSDDRPPLRRVIGRFGGKDIVAFTRGPIRENSFTPQASSRNTSGWKSKLSSLRMNMEHGSSDTIPRTWPPQRQVIYILEFGRRGWANDDGLIVEIATRSSLKSIGKQDRPKQIKLYRSDIANAPDPVDRLLLQILAGATTEPHITGYIFQKDEELPKRVRILPSAAVSLVRQLCETSRCLIRRTHGQKDPTPVVWDEGGVWQLTLEINPRPGTASYRVDASLRRGEQRMELSATNFLAYGLLVFWDNKVAPMDDGGALNLLAAVRAEPEWTIPSSQVDDFIAELVKLPRLPKLVLPQTAQTEQVTAPPQPRLMITPQPRQGLTDDHVRGSLSFNYAGHTARPGGPAILHVKASRKLIHRDRAAEAAASAELATIGFRQEYDYAQGTMVMKLPTKQMPRAVLQLLGKGWHVEVAGEAYRQPRTARIEVSSGIDWFDVTGNVEFEGASVGLPRLLQAISRGEMTVKLDDGSTGIISDEWAARFGLLANIGQTEDDSLRFGKNQIGLLDALLASQPDVSADETFRLARIQLREFQGVTSAPAPETFTGTLRPYQEEGLGWLTFLRKFGLGGCLADDMGLGKTIQVLALLEQRRLARAAGGDDAPVGPTLVVVPRSLVFNWKQEAARFTPQLKVLDHTSAERARTADALAGYDLILTTYGTLRNDAKFLREAEFDYVILDEAQAIKNSASESAKAARLLRPQHRLALSGTPVQNHLGELWSLFEFLNPGMLGNARALQSAPAAQTGAPARGVDEDTRIILAKALRPFILRRTKEQVARDLPEKTEQTIWCDLDKGQRELYDELRQHYRQSLLGHIDANGMGKSRMQVLEALLRLRQCACHPGLIDKDKADLGSAKLDTLLAQLEEVLEEGHKCLVFSQFTSLLALVRTRLDAKKVVYEYLDGRTRDRQERVARFQTDPDCKLFLISLKAGGVGLNLTAAEYVFLLDPWWNPAVEAQAIDRAHRIGQVNKVFAYRLIARGTVEEKVLELQKSKRDLADAIINADNSLLSKLGREELEILLS